MADPKTLQKVIHAPENVWDKLSPAPMLRAIGKNLWSGWLQISAGGFGKGIIIAALAAVAIGATSGAALAPVALEQGLVAGATEALGFLVTVPGALLLAAGGALGLIANSPGSGGRVTAKAAMAEEKRFEQLRGESPQPEIAQEPASKMSFTERETARRGNAALTR